MAPIEYITSTMKVLISLFLMVGYLNTAHSQTPKIAETVSVNGLDTYYEVYGEGEPVFFLHGWTSSSRSWHEYVSHYANHFEVYLVDLLGHGRSSPFMEEFSLKDAADQFGALLDYLELDEVSAVGLSYGADLLLQFTSTNAYRVTAMVVIGGTYHYPRRDIDWNYDDVSERRLAQLREEHVHGEDQIKAFYTQVDNYEILLTEEDLKQITTSALIIVGEYEHWFELDIPLTMRNHMPNSHLWIVPNKGHVAISGTSRPEFIRLSTEFLKGEWEE